MKKNTADSRTARLRARLSSAEVSAEASAEASVEPSRVSSPEWVCVSVSDTGVGIPPENLDKLFEPLFTTRVKGIGLGLALAKSLVEGHGGTIEVESEAGKGSTFTVRLPLGGVDSNQQSAISEQ